MVAMAAAVTLGFVIGGLNALTPRVALSASVSSAVSASKHAVTTSTTKVGGKSYLRVQVTSKYGTTKKFSVKQRVCVKSACRTVTSALSIKAGRTAWQGIYLGTGTYKKSGAPSVSATTPKPAPSASAPRPTATATIRVTETVTVTTVATVTVTATPTATPTVTVTVTQAPGTEALCGAPANSYGFTFCGTGDGVPAPAENACDVFECIDYFPNGRGYLVMCNDQTVSLSGGISGSCSSHNGVLRTIYRTAA
jgi:hypothetical protein